MVEVLVEILGIVCILYNIYIYYYYITWKSVMIYRLIADLKYPLYKATSLTSEYLPRRICRRILWWEYWFRCSLCPFGAPNKTNDFFGWNGETFVFAPKKHIQIHPAAFFFARHPTQTPVAIMLSCSSSPLKIQWLLQTIHFLLWQFRRGELALSGVK